MLTLLFIFDFLPASQKKIGEDIDDYLTVYERNISLHMGNIVAASQRLAPELVNAVEKTLAQNNAQAAKPYNVEISLGFADYDPQLTIPELIERTDQALYINKGISKSAKRRAISVDKFGLL